MTKKCLRVREAASKRVRKFGLLCLAAVACINFRGTVPVQAAKESGQETMSQETQGQESADGTAEEEWTQFGAVPIKFSYTPQQENVFVRGLLDSAAFYMERAGKTKEELEEMMGSLIEAIIFPGEYTLEESPYVVYMWLKDGYTEEDTYLEANASEEELSGMTECIGEYYTDPFQIQEEKQVGNYQYLILQCENKDGNPYYLYATVWNGDLAVFELVYDEADAAGAVSYLEGILTSFYEEREYSFLDGRLSLSFNEEKFDVFTEDNTDNQVSLKRQGFSQQLMDAYMDESGYALKAVNVGDVLTESSIQFCLNIKDPKYEGIDNLKELSEDQETELAKAIVSSFASAENATISHTDSVDYIVFDCNMGFGAETRYATIIDERMIYFIMKSSGESVTDEDRMWLNSIMDTVKWTLD